MGRGWLVRSRLLLLPHRAPSLPRPRSRLPLCHCLFATVAAATVLLCLLRLSPTTMPTPSLAYVVPVSSGLRLAQNVSDRNKTNYVESETSKRFTSIRHEKNIAPLTPVANTVGSPGETDDRDDTVDYNVGFVADGKAIGNTAGSISVGKTGEGETVGNTAEGNPVGNKAEGNPVGNTATGKSVGNSAAGKTVGHTASGKTVGNTAAGKTVGNTAAGKTVGNTAEGKTIGHTAADKTVGNTASGKTIGNTASGKTVSDTVGGSTSGTGNTVDNTVDNTVGKTVSNIVSNFAAVYGDYAFTATLPPIETIATAEGSDRTNIMKIETSNPVGNQVEKKGGGGKTKAESGKNATSTSAPPPDPEADRLGPLRDLYPGGFDDPCTALVERCLRLPGPAVLALVFSAPTHAAARVLVRDTWVHTAREKIFDKAFDGNPDNDTWISVGFLVGRTDDPKTEQALEEEQRKYGDLVRPAFQDTYRNLTLKSIAMLEWFSKYCKGARMLLKVDDDVAVNARSLLQFAHDNAAFKTSLFGRVYLRRTPFRDPTNKYYTSPAQWPKGKLFPDFAQGPAYALTGDAPPLLFAAAMRKSDPIMFLPVEDVLLSGVLAKQAKVKVRPKYKWLGRMLTPKGLGTVGPNCPKPKELAVHPVPTAHFAEVVRRMNGICPAGKPVKSDTSKSTPKNNADSKVR